MPSDDGGAARIARLERSLAREKGIRHELEQMLEDKSREAYEAAEQVKRQTRLVATQGVTKILAETRDLALAAPRMMRVFCEMLGWDAGALWTRDGDELACAAFFGMKPCPTFEHATRAIAFRIGVGLPGRAWETSAPAWIEDIIVDANFPRGNQAGVDGFRAACAFPVLAKGELVGAIELFSHETRKVDDELLVVLMALGQEIGAFLERQSMEQRILQAELAAAKGIQEAILPKSFPGLDVGTFLQPASEVGGDYFDVLPRRDGAWLAIGDVAGHGLAAGLVMLMVQTGVASLLQVLPDASPAQLVASLNAMLYVNIRGRMKRDEHVTLTLLRYSATDGTVTFAGAHEDILVVRAKGVERIPTRGTWVGAAADIRTVTVDDVLTLADGDLLVLYTDGVTEAANERGARYGIDRVADALGSRRELPLSEVVRAIREDVLAWAPRLDDDIALLVLRHHRRSA